MTTNSIPFFARRLAEAEADHGTAVQAHAERMQEAQELHGRQQAVEERIAALRSTAATRELTEVEAASLNIALMDKADLAEMVVRADKQAVDAAQAMQHEAGKVAAARSELQRATAEAELDALKAEVRIAEERLVELLQRLWEKSQATNPGERFVALWQPASELRRAAVYNQPPGGGFSG